MLENPERRQIPKLLKTILATDVYLTDAFVKLVEKCLPLRQLQVHYKLLELSCHGVPWLAITFALIWAFDSKNLYQMQVNFIIGLLIDIVAVCVLKAIAKRKRPTLNNNLFFIGPDKYSFPSGHASRAIFITYFFFYVWPVSLIFISLLSAWSISVCISRLLMRRHHILDVFCGILLGIFEGMIIDYIYLEQEMCVCLISWVIKDI